MVGRRFAYSGRMLVEQIEDEVVRMLSRYLVAIQLFRWEILQIESDDQIGATLNGGSQYMTIIGVR